MLAHGEICIRLLGEVAGDKASTHAVNVAVLSLLLGKTFGPPESDMQDLGVGAVLHDVGKLEVPSGCAIATTTSRRRSARLPGARRLRRRDRAAHGAGRRRTPGHRAAPRARRRHRLSAAHRQRPDGAGRIVAPVNRYDNLCNPHIPSRALTPHEALSLLFAQGKTKFDAAILGAFVKMMGVYPPGSAVQLTDDRFALVVTVNASRPLKPRVLVHDPHVPTDEALLLDLESRAGWPSGAASPAGPAARGARLPLPAAAHGLLLRARRASPSPRRWGDFWPRSAPSAGNGRADGDALSRPLPARRLAAA